MKGAIPSPRSGVAAFSAAERPDLGQQSLAVFHHVWPEYNHHGNHSAAYFGALVPQHAHLQFVFQDVGTEQLIARGRMIPFRWDGSIEDLPVGIDGAGLRSVEDERPPTSVSALAAEVRPDFRGGGVSRLVIEAMAHLAQTAGLAPLLAPVRPNWKDRYPLTPIERYARWMRPDGLPFDPWMRVHARLGAEILRAEPRSLQIHAPVADWERWTEMAFPEDGEYVFPLGLAPLTISDGVGRYWEPNVWMRHHI